MITQSHVLTRSPAVAEKESIVQRCMK